MRIRRLLPTDLDPIAAILAAAYGRSEGWRDEVARFQAVQPEGWFAAEVEGRLAGMGGATNYGPFAWIGLMGVDPARQRQGVGRAILEAVLAWIHERGCPTAVLDASAAGRRLYEQFGFVDDGATLLWRLAPRPGPHSHAEQVTLVQPSDLAELVHFDTPIFGANRAAILASFLADPRIRALVTRDDTGAIAGYLCVQPDRLGPWVATSAGAAELLLAAALSRSTRAAWTVRVPSINQAAAPLLAGHGFTLERSLRHMYLGPAPPRQERRSIYSAASFAIG